MVAELFVNAIRSGPLGGGPRAGNVSRLKLGLSNSIVFHARQGPFAKRP